MWEKRFLKFGIFLEVNNEVLVETWMAKRCIADYTNTYSHGFAYFVLHPSFKRPFFVGKNSNLKLAFTFWDLILWNRVKVYYYFVTMQWCSIIQKKSVIFSHTRGRRSTVIGQHKTENYFNYYVIIAITIYRVAEQSLNLIFFRRKTLIYSFFSSL